MLYGDRLMIDDHGRHVGSWVLPRHDDHTLAHVDYVPQETLFWRRRTWDAVGARVDSRRHIAHHPWHRLKARRAVSTSVF